MTMTVVQTYRINQLYEARFGHLPDFTDPAKAAHYVLWRYGGEALLDAVKRIEELLNAEAMRKGEEMKLAAERRMEEIMGPAGEGGSGVRSVQIDEPKP